MDPIVIRSETELSETLAAIIKGIRSGIEAGNEGGAIAQLPEYVDIEVVYLVAANVGTITQQTIAPEITETQTQTTPERVVTRAETRAESNSESASPAGSVTIRENEGEDETAIEREYEEV